jgi:hypothetical protein
LKRTVWTAVFVVLLSGVGFLVYELYPRTSKDKERSARAVKTEAFTQPLPGGDQSGAAADAGTSSVAETRENAREPHRPARASEPRFEPQGEPAARDATRTADTVDPRSESYNPIDDQILRLNADPWDVIAAEPRVPEFADRRERFIADIVRGLLASNDLSALVALERVQCFSSSCVIHVSFADASIEFTNAVLSVLQPNPPLFDYMTNQIVERGDGGRRIVMALLFRPASRRHDAYESRVHGPPVGQSRHSPD